MARGIYSRDRERLLRVALRLRATARVPKLPQCDVPMCTQVAVVDGKTVYGHWAYMCPRHFRTLGVGLGLGRGQVLVLESEPLE